MVLKAFINWLLPVPKKPDSWTTYSGHVNNARDIPISSGTKVISPTAGKVVQVGEKNDGRGGTVKIQTKDGATIWLSHLKQFASGLKVGDTVKKGQFVGFSGGGKEDPMRGKSTGPHLHFEVTDASGRGIDPLYLYTGDNTYKDPGTGETVKAPGGSPETTVGDIVEDPTGVVGDVIQAGLVGPLIEFIDNIDWTSVIVGIIGIGLIVVGVAGLASEQAIGIAAGKLAKPIAEAIKQ